MSVCVELVKLRRLHTIEDALFHKARVSDIKFKLNFTPGASETTLEVTEAAAMPTIKQMDLLVRYQTTLDRQLSKSIGELMVVKANALLTGVRQLPTH